MEKDTAEVLQPHGHMICVLEITGYHSCLLVATCVECIDIKEIKEVDYIDGVCSDLDISVHQASLISVYCRTR